MRECSTLTDLAQAEIDALQADGIALTPAEIVKINWLATQVETPEHRMLYARGCPVFVGGVILWPMTARAAEWFKRTGLAMPASLHERALAYALAYGRSDGTELDRIGRVAESAVKAWAVRLTCTDRELTQAASQIIAQTETDEMPPVENASQDGMTAGDMSAFLCAAAGGTADMWERQVSSAYVLAVLRSIIAQNRADDRPVAGDARIDANKALGWYCHLIRESRKGAANG